MTTGRKQRANGVESRRRILDATVEIAGERGYEGTSIAAVSAKCGLPAGSIYWHFKDKDDLIAAVIERSFESRLAAVELPARRTVRRWSGSRRWPRTSPRRSSTSPTSCVWA